MDDLNFDDLPFSYRLSQRLIMAAVVSLIFSRTLAVQQWPLMAKWAVGAIIGLMVLSALLTSCYVVIRYPYLSLVPTRDGDIFSAQFNSKRLLGVLKALGTMMLFLIAAGLSYDIFVRGNAGLGQLATWGYTLILLCFVLFLCVVYDADAHPTVATFIRSTLGLGVLLAPVFLPVLVIGSVRCGRLLDEELFRQELET